MPTGDLDPERRFAEKEQARRADVEALRPGRKTKAQLKRETEAFAFPPAAHGSIWTHPVPSPERRSAIHGVPKSQDAFEVALRLSLDEAQRTRAEIKLLASQSISFVAGSTPDEHYL